MECRVDELTGFQAVRGSLYQGLNIPHRFAPANSANQFWMIVTAVSDAALAERFTRKRDQAIRIAGKQARQNLQRDMAIELGISRAIDLTHSPSTDS